MQTGVRVYLGSMLSAFIGIQVCLTRSDVPALDRVFKLNDFKEKGLPTPNMLAAGLTGVQSSVVRSLDERRVDAKQRLTYAILPVGMAHHRTNLTIL